MFVVFIVTHSQMEEKWNFFVFPHQLIVLGSINPDCNTKEKESGKSEAQPPQFASLIRLQTLSQVPPPPLPLPFSFCFV